MAASNINSDKKPYGDLVNKAISEVQKSNLQPGDLRAVLGHVHVGAGGVLERERSKIKDQLCALCIGWTLSIRPFLDSTRQIWNDHDVT